MVHTVASTHVPRLWCQFHLSSAWWSKWDTHHHTSLIYPRWSMYGISIYICSINDPNVGKYTIHWAYGYWMCCCQAGGIFSHPRRIFAQSASWQRFRTSSGKPLNLDAADIKTQTQHRLRSKTAPSLRVEPSFLSKQKQHSQLSTHLHHLPGSSKKGDFEACVKFLRRLVSVLALCPSLRLRLSLEPSCVRSHRTRDQCLSPSWVQSSLGHPYSTM